MGAWKWATRIFAVIGAIASLVTIIAWATTGAVSYPIVVLLSSQTSTVTVTAVGTTAPVSTVTNIVTSTVITNNQTLINQVRTLRLQIVTVSGYAKATGQGATAKSISFQTTLPNGNVLTYQDNLNASGYYTLRVLNNQTYTISISWQGYAYYFNTSTASQSPFKVVSSSPSISQNFTA